MAAEKVFPEIPLDEELKRQQRVAVGIAVELGMTEQDALEALPKRFPERMLEYNKLEVNTPLIVPRFRGFSWLQLIEAANLGISDYLKGRIDDLSDWQDPRVVEVLDKPYAGWFYIGDRYKYRRPVDVREELHPVEVASDHWGGAALAILRPDIVRVKLFDLIGGQVGSDCVPSVGWWDGRPGFRARLVVYAFPNYQALVRGSKVEA